MTSSPDVDNKKVIIGQILIESTKNQSIINKILSNIVSNVKK